MGNSIATGAEVYDSSDENDASGIVEIPPELLDELAEENISQLVRSILGRVNRLSAQNREMPIIRRRPDISTFRYTELFKEIKALNGFPPTSRLPCENFNLVQGIMKRENGTVSNRCPMGSFTQSQQRRIRTLFVPNNREKRLMSLESKLFVSSFNKDGSKLLTASQDAIMRIYDSSKGTYHLVHRMRLPDVNWSILDVDISPCDQFFAYSTWSDYFFVIPMNGDVEKAEWYDIRAPLLRNAVFSIRFSPLGGSLIGGCSNSCVYICDMETRAIRTIRTKPGVTVDINAVSFVSDKNPNLFVSGCDTGTVKLWDIRCAGNVSNSNDDHRNQNRRVQPAGVFLGHLDGVTYIDSRNDGNYILSNSKDQSIKIWDLRRPTHNSKVNKHLYATAIDWDYRGDTVPQEYYNPMHPMDGDVSVMTYRGHRVTKSLLRAKFSPLEQTGQRYIYTGCSTGRIIIYDVLTGHIKEAIHGHKDIVRDLAWHPVRSEIISSSWDSYVNLNTFKPDPLGRRTTADSSSSSSVPRRRSRRLERRNNNGDVTVEIERDGPNMPW